MQSFIAIKKNSERNVGWVKYVFMYEYINILIQKSFLNRQHTYEWTKNSKKLADFTLLIASYYKGNMGEVEDNCIGYRLF